MMKKILTLLLVLLSVSGMAEKKSDAARLEFTGPTGMVVWHENRKLGPAPLALKLTPGSYVFKYTAPGCEPRWEIFQLKKGMTRKCHINLKPQLGMVLLQSTPAGAEVIFNGESRGVTPLVIEKLPIGEYHAKLRLPGYAATNARWTVSDARPVLCTTDITANIGKLKISSVPAGAQLWVDGKMQGKTPRELALGEGRYLIRVEKAGYLPQEKDFAITTKCSVNYKFELVQVPGKLVIKSVPSGAEVLLNGRNVGQTPYTTSELPPGHYQLTLKKVNFDDEIKNVVVQSGRTDEINLVMGKNIGSAELLLRPAGIRVSVDGRELGVVAKDESFSSGTRPFVIENLTPGIHTVTISHPDAQPPTMNFPIRVVKGGCYRGKMISMWIANCELTYKDGHKEVGALYRQNRDSILFGVEPGVTIEVDRNRIKKLKMLGSGF